MPRQNLDKACAATLRRSAILLTAVAMLMLALPAAGVGAASSETIDDTLPVSITTAGEYADRSTGEKPSISDDGRYVAFQSAADNLGEHGPSGVSEAYVKDLKTGEVKLVSRAEGVNGEPANEPGEATGVENVFISGDGRYAIFTSDASNLVTGLPPTEEATEHPLHVYRRDLQTGETALVDRVTGREGAILDERGPEAEAISEEGRYVLFRDHVENLESATGVHEAGLSTVYIRDLIGGTTTAVSRASGPEGELANEKSRASSISPDGRYVAFESSATNLVAGMGANAVSQVYLRDTRTHTTILFSKTAPTEAAPNGEPGNASSEDPILIGNDGCKVAFESAATNLYLYQGKPVSSPQVYLADLCSTPASTTLVSRADGEAGAPAGEGNAVIPTPVGASADGKYVLFSAFSELTGEVSNASTHLYLRDLGTGHTTLIDRASGAHGGLANSNPEGSTVSANGCRVVFATEASNLGEPQAPRERVETYVRQLAPCHEEPAVMPTSGNPAHDTSAPAQGLAAQQGSAGASSEQSPRAGAASARRARHVGPAGRDVKVTCLLAGHARKVTCLVTFKGKKISRGARARLTKGGRTYARGSLASLRPSRAIRRGIYTLRVMIDGHTLAIRVQLR